MEIRKTAGGVVVGPNGRIVVVNQNGDSWSLPKGGIDEGETARLAAEREIREESGIKDLRYICRLGAYSRPRIGKGGQGEVAEQMKDIIFFLFFTNHTRLAPQDPGNPEAVWLSLSEAVERLTHEKDKEFLRSKVPVIEQALKKL